MTSPPPDRLEEPPEEPEDAPQGADDQAGTGAAEGRTVALLAVIEALSKVASFVMFMVVTRLLSVSEFGLFSWALALSMLPVAFAVWGFGSTVIQHGSGNRKSVPTLLTEAILWRLILGVPVIILLALPIWGEPQYRLGLVLVGIASLADTFNELIRYGAGAIARQRAVAYNLLIQRILVTILVIVTVYKWPNATAMAAAYCLGTLLGVAAMLVSAARIGLMPRWGLVTRDGMRAMWSRSHAVGLSGVLNTLTFRSDTVLLGWLSTLSATGVYAAAYRLFETALFLIYSMVRVTAPKMAAETDKPKLLKLVSLTPTILICLFLPYVLVLAVRGSDVMTLVFGSQYGGVESGLTLAVLGLTLVPYAVQFLSQSALIARKINRQVLIGAILALVVNVAVNLALIPLWGPVGAALGTFVAMGAQWVYLRIVVYRRIGPAPIWGSVWPALIAAALMVPVAWAIPNVIIASVVGSLVYLVALALLYRWLRPSLFALARQVVGR